MSYVVCCSGPISIHGRNWNWLLARGAPLAVGSWRVAQQSFVKVFFLGGLLPTPSRGWNVVTRRGHDLCSTSLRSGSVAVGKERRDVEPWRRAVRGWQRVPSWGESVIKIS